MYTINTRRLLHLFGRKVAILFAFICAFNCLYAQKYDEGNYNFRQFNQKSYYFGITLGYNTSGYKPFRSKDFINSDSILQIESVNGPGFNLGIVTNLKIGNNFDLRFLPTLSFAERSIRYKRNASGTNFSDRRAESVFVEMPFHLRYKSAPFHDIRLFVIGGVKYAFDVASEARARQAETLVKIAPNDFSVEYGAGMQIFFPFFIFSPEFKVSHGIGNILIYNPNLEESTVLEKVLSRSFTISLHFEG